MLYMGSDHGGWRLKHALLPLLQQNGIAFVDVGTASDVSCDYPVFAQKVAQAVAKNHEHRGVLICTSGIGMSIAANKFKGVYAACIDNAEVVAKAREHNGINVLCLPGNLGADAAYRLIAVFLATPLDDAERHHRRRQQIAAFERQWSHPA